MAKKNDSELRREVKEFGNGAHVTLPGEYVGETVVIQPVDGAEDTKTLQPPITKEKVRSALLESDWGDFTFEQRESDHYPCEGRYRYDHDLRLSIGVELAHESGAASIIESETGRVIHKLGCPTVEELSTHADWWSESDKPGDFDQFEDVFLCIDPDASEIFDHADVVYGDVYRYTLEWNGSEISSFLFTNRQAANGRFYRPMWQQYDSLEEYRESFAYVVANTISEAPKSDYDKYLELMTERGINWGSRDTDLARAKELSRDEILRETIICPL